MDSGLSWIQATRKSGTEVFHCGGVELGFTLLDFWQWADSDLISNACRGRLAEFIVARALGLGTADVRNEWDSVDLQTSGGTKVEVKSAAYVQSWFQKKLSTISFVVPPRRGYDYRTNELEPEPRRHADVYVFAILVCQDQASINPLDISQWEFYVVPTTRLSERERSQHSITFKSLKQLDCRPVAFAELRNAVESVAKNLESRPSG